MRVAIKDEQDVGTLPYPDSIRATRFNRGHTL
jgi:hypothetical protein